MMVIFLVGLVGMILIRTLRKDYQRYGREDELDEMERDLGDEYGWKQVRRGPAKAQGLNRFSDGAVFVVSCVFPLCDQVHGDVFRSAAHPMLLSSLVGTGAQVMLAPPARWRLVRCREPVSLVVLSSQDPHVVPAPLAYNL